MENPDETIDGDVTVVIDAGAGAPVVEEPAETVVVVAPPAVAPEQGSSSAELLERIVNLERDVAELRGEVFDAELSAGEAEEAAQLALDVALDVAEKETVTEEAIDESIDELSEEIEEADIVKDENGEEHLQMDEITPSSAKVHPLFRPASDWFGKR